MASHGSLDVALPWASVTKLVTAYMVLVGVQRGVLALDDAGRAAGLDGPSPAGARGGYRASTTRVISAPGRTRIYSNTGFDALGDAVEAAAGRPFADAHARSGCSIRSG